MGRDVGRDEGREQAEWRDLVARLELQVPIDPAEAPWPDRENLRAKTQPGPSAGSDATAEADEASPGDPPSAADGPEGADQEDARAGDAKDGDAKDDDAGPADGHGRRGPADRSRVIKPAGSTKFCGPAAEPSAQASADAASSRQPDNADGSPGSEKPVGSAAPAGRAEAADHTGSTTAGPRDYELDEPRDEDLDELWDNRYIPPLVPPQPTLDPVAKGAWLALFGGPGYLLVATLLGWQIVGWAALASVIAFVTGFVILVFRLGDGPSKRDGPDQGAVV